MNVLLGDDWARPAKDLPFKVIRDLGHMLHRAPYTSGNWETVAEDLGYGFQEIKQFNTLASVKQDCTPGELMLRDWVQRRNGRTLFVLHSALSKAERLDCVKYLEAEVFRKVVCMELMICVKHEDGQPTVHQSIPTKADSSLLESLKNVLTQPVYYNYKLLDPGVSWTHTQAKEFKGRQLMLLKRRGIRSLEQDPTIDSSSVDCIVTDTVVRNRHIVISDSISAGVTSLSTVTVADQVHSTTSCISQTSPRCAQSDSTLSTGITVSWDTRNNRHSPSGSGVISKKTQLTSAGNRPRSQSLHAESEMVNTRTRSFSVHANCSSCYCASTCNDLSSQGAKNQGSFLKTVVNIPSSEEKINNILPVLPRNKCQGSKPDYFIIKADVLENVIEGSNTDSCEDNNAVKEMDCNEISQNSMSDEEYIPLSDTSICTKSETEGHRYLAELDHLTDTSFGDSITDDPPYCVDPESRRNVQDIDDNQFVYGSKDTGNDDREMHAENSEYVDSSERMNETEFHNSFPSFPSGGFDVSNHCESYVDSNTRTTPEDLSEDLSDLHTSAQCDSRSGFFHTAEYQLAKNYSSGSDDHITKLKKSYDAKTRDIEGVCIGIGDNCPNRKWEDGFNPYIDSDTVNKNEENCLQIRQYIDFNKYDQHDKNELEEDSSSVSTIYSPDSESSPKRLTLGQFMGEISNQCKIPLTVGSKFMYESLQRGMSCPADVFYEKTDMFSSEHEMPTIADVFSPVTEGFKLDDFEMGAQNSLEISCTGCQTINEMSLEGTTNTESVNSFVSKNNTLPLMRNKYDSKKTEPKCNTLHDNEEVCFENDFCEYKQTDDSKLETTGGQHICSAQSPSMDREFSNFSQLLGGDGCFINSLQPPKNGQFSDSHQRTPQKFPQLPPRGDLKPLNTVSSKTSQASNDSESRMSVDIHRSSSGLIHCGQQCKIVIGGKTRRPPLDSLLADDKLFLHYNTVLQGIPGWSPRETENTILKTMDSSMSHDGYYILWYIRERKNLVLSVTFKKSLVNYRVRTKVLKGQLHYYIVDKNYFSDVIHLLQHCIGCGMQSPSRNNSGRTLYKIALKCPVLVQYEKKPAISI